jgi:hypothetical protein
MKNIFQQEALQQNPDYQPESVNPDGWEATKIAWKSLFPSITLILCFLHTVLGIQQRYRRQGGLFRVVTEKLYGRFTTVSIVGNLLNVCGG